MENVRRHRDVNLVTTERRRNYLVSGSNLHTTKFSTEHLLAIKIKKKKTTEILVNKPVYLGLPILELSKISMYERHGEKPKHCFLDTNTFIVQV